MTVLVYVFVQDLRCDQKTKTDVARGLVLPPDNETFCRLGLH